MATVIETVNLTKRYRDFYAVKDVSLQIKTGEIYGFIGLNGAGKTTLIRMLLGLIKPSSGECFINGNKVTRTSTDLWRNVGHIVETPYSYPELTVTENLHIQRRLHAIKDRTVVQNIMRELHLTKYQDVKSKDLSLGNVQRLGIAKALVHSPKILILDEPVNGLDPKGIVEMRTLLQNLSITKNVTIFMSSHLLSEIAKIATKIGVIHEGKMIEEIDVTILYRRLNQRLIINTKDNAQASDLLKGMGKPVRFTKDGKIETYDEKAIAMPEEITLNLVKNGLSPSEIHVTEEDLESYFLRKIQTKETL